jgi:hypothetical protein
LAGYTFCATRFRTLLGLNKSKFHAFKESIAAGSVSLPPDKRKCRQTVEVASVAFEHASAWLAWIYHNLAEPLAETLVEASGTPVALPGEASELVALPLNPVVGTTAPQGKRHLPPGSIKELYELYQAEGDACSERTFYRAWKLQWSKYLCFRRHSEHSQCTLCCKYQKSWADAVLKLEKDLIASEHLKHLRVVYADRRCYATMQRFSIESTKALISKQQVMCKVSKSVCVQFVPEPCLSLLAGCPGCLCWQR